MTATDRPSLAQGEPENVQLLVLDVDGVLTDGSIILDEKGTLIYRFDVQDGAGMNYWHRAGFRTALITGRQSQAVVIRAEQMGVKLVYQNAKRKLQAFRQCLADSGATAEEICYVGDDLPDLPVMRCCGYPVAVANAVPEVKAAARYVTRTPGGRGAVREVIEHLLKAKGLWQQVMDFYDRQKLDVLT